MFRVKVLKNSVQKFGSEFNTEAEAKEWVKKQEAKGSWGKKAVEMVVTEVKKPMELIEEVSGPMGIKAYKVRLPADYEVVIEEYEEELHHLGQIQHILKNTDWLFISDVPIEQNDRKMYREYRQHLRNLRLTSKLETFEEWLRRTHPEKFMEGKRGPELVKKFNTYL
jgi:hypothetical protein